jgi:hypothetical protein
MIERHRKTKFLRVTDHKTGKNRTQEGKTVVDGGRVLQPVIYGLALTALFPEETVFAGRLFYCTNAGGFHRYEIPLMGEAPKRGIEVLDIIDRAIERRRARGSPGRQGPATGVTTSRLRPPGRAKDAPKRREALRRSRLR